MAAKFASIFDISRLESTTCCGATPSGWSICAMILADYAWCNNTYIPSLPCCQVCFVVLLHVSLFVRGMQQFVVFIE